MAQPNKEIKRFSKCADKAIRRSNGGKTVKPHPLDKTKNQTGEVGNPKKK